MTQVSKLSLFTGVLVMLSLPGCTTLDEHYHAYMDNDHKHAIPADKKQEAEQRPEGESETPARHEDHVVIQGASGDNSQQTSSTSAPREVEGVALAPATTLSSIETSAEDTRSQWQYRPDSRDKTQALGDTMSSEPEQKEWQDPLITGYQPDRTHKALADYASQLAMQLMDSATQLSGNDLIGVASFVRLNRSLQEPTVMGNQLSELLITELQSFGVGVVDFKMADALTVTPVGDLAMTRAAEAQSRQLQMDHILTGTLIEEPRGVRVNARIVSTKMHQVVASTTLLIPSFMVTQLNSVQSTEKKS